MDTTPDDPDLTTICNRCLYQAHYCVCEPIPGQETLL